MDAVRAKSLALTELFISPMAARRVDHPLELVTPRDPVLRLPRKYSFGDFLS